MMAKPITALELHFPMIQFLIIKFGLCVIHVLQCFSHKDQSL